MSAEQPEVAVTLFRLAPAFGLPSLSVACLQVEAYLRLGGVQFAVHDCRAPSASPTGQVPALENQADLVGADGVAAGASPPLAEFAAARVMIDYLKRKVVDLDRGLSSAQRAEAAAFSALVESRLQPAILYTTWCEPAAYAAHTRPAYGAGLPFPLSRLVPRSQRNAVAAHFAGTDGGAVYAAAAEALEALSARLAAGASAAAGGSSGGVGSGSGGPYFFGGRASSLDAALYASLAFLRAAPVVHSQLARKLQGCRPLLAYLERLEESVFAVPAPSAADAGLDWSAWAAAADDKYSKAKAEKETELQRKGRRWLLCAGAAIAAYLVLTGQYLQFAPIVGYEYVEEDEEEK